MERTIRDDELFHSMRNLANVKKEK